MVQKYNGPSTVSTEPETTEASSLDSPNQDFDEPPIDSLTADATSSAVGTDRSLPNAPRVDIPLALKHWDRYEVLAVLGSGGMGAVYKSYDPRLNRFVAVKIVHPMLGHSDPAPV